MIVRQLDPQLRRRIAAIRGQTNFQRPDSGRDFFTPDTPQRRALGQCPQNVRRLPRKRHCRHRNRKIVRFSLSFHGIHTLQRIHHHDIPALPEHLFSLFRHKRQTGDGTQYLFGRQFSIVIDHVPDQFSKSQFPFTQHHQVHIGVLEHRHIIAGGIRSARHNWDIEPPLPDHRRNLMEKTAKITESADTDHLGRKIVEQSLQLPEIIKIDAGLGDHPLHPAGEFPVQISQ